MLRNYQENKLSLDGGDLAEKNSLTIVKRVAAECFLIESTRIDEKIMREIFIRDDVTKVCEKNIYQINFAKITFQ